MSLHFSFVDLKFKFARKNVGGQIDSLSLNYLNARKKAQNIFNWKIQTNFENVFPRVTIL
jgi:hypothetical protein